MRERRDQVERSSRERTARGGTRTEGESGTEARARERDRERHARGREACARERGERERDRGRELHFFLFIKKFVLMILMPKKILKNSKNIQKNINFLTKITLFNKAQGKMYL